jgi:DNA-binding CsgD family transcriptional regulator
VRLAWPLTGRAKEMRLIEAAISDPGSSGIVICGAAGVGKSRIAREALDSAASKGYEVRWVVGTSSARALPLGALASWAGSTGSDSLQLVRGVIESLTTAPPGAGVVVGVDDVHLLDDLSTFVVHQVIQRSAAKVVLTVRDGEPIPTGTRELWKAGQFDRLDLQPLSRDATATLVSATLGGTLDPDAAARLWTVTLGNVLYLRNIVEQEVADGRLAQQGGFWRWLGEPVVPPGLVELIESRIGALSSSVSDVVDALAVGEPLELGALARITDPAAVEEADMRGLITLEPVDDGMEVRLAHRLYGEVRRKRAAPTRLRRLRGLVAAELAASEDRDDVRIVVRRATLSLDSDLRPDADLLVRAAKGAVWLLDRPLADRLADAAIRAGGGPEAHFIRAFILSWLNRGREAEAVLAEISTSELTDVDRARLVFLRATNRLWALADPAGAKALIDDASRTTSPRARSFIGAFLTVYWAAMGKPEAARESSKNVARDELPDVVARMTAWALTVAAGDAGRTAEAVAAAEAGYPTPMRGFLTIADAHVGALLLSGQIADAQDVVEMLRHHAADYPSPQLVPIMPLVSGRAAVGAGRLDTACGVLGPAVEALTTSGETIGLQYRCQLARMIALAMRGLTDEAAAALAALQERRYPHWRYLDYERGIAKAWVAAAQGAVSEAIRILLSAAETARSNGQFAAEVMCLQTATQFGDRSTVPRLRELEALVEGPRVGLAACFAVALRDGDAAELASVSEDFEAMADLVAAVDAAAQAAMAYRRQDLRGSALGCVARAEALAEDCGGADTPALRQAREPLPLTDREREIVMLLGQGLSNRDVAARLTVSVRTVEGHIYKAMAKTGTASREELAALLPRRRPQTHE